MSGLPTTGGSIALQKSMPSADAALVAKLKAAGAIVLGKTNVSELGGLFDANMPEGYSSLGGQVLLPSDTDKTPAGSSAGSAAATAAGLAALTVGLETSTDTAQLIAPAGVAGVVALKPTVGAGQRRGRVAGSPSPRTRPGRSRAPSPTRRPRWRRSPAGSYAAALSPSLAGKKIDVDELDRRAVSGRDHGARRGRRDDDGQGDRHAVSPNPPSIVAASSSATSTRSWPAVPAARSHCRRSSTTTPPTRSRA